MEDHEKLAQGRRYMHCSIAAILLVTLITWLAGSNGPTCSVANTLVISRPTSELGVSLISLCVASTWCHHALLGGDHIHKLVIKGFTSCLDCAALWLVKSQLITVQCSKCSNHEWSVHSLCMFRTSLGHRPSHLLLRFLNFRVRSRWEILGYYNSVDPRLLQQSVDPRLL